MDAGATTKQRMISFATSEGSPFLADGRDMLVSEFGKEYGIYFSIMQLIAAGKNTQSGIDSIIQKKTSSYIANLEREYLLLKRVKPIFDKPGSRNTKLRIGDQYLRFWFRFVFPSLSLIETGRLDLLKALVLREYEAFSGHALEDYFRTKIAEESDFDTIGSSWNRKGTMEIDIVALDKANHSALIAEVKRNPEKLRDSILQMKAESIAQELSEYETQYALLSMDDM
jgi:AAA+ ATPase superfamily predicted ATPase